MWKELGDVAKALFHPQFRRWLGGASLVVGLAALFVPPSWFASLRLAPLSEPQRTIAAAVALVGLFGVVVEAMLWIRLRVMRFSVRRHRIARLKDLTPDEKQILCGYVLVNQRTQYFQAQDGVVMGLVADGVLYQSASLGSLYGGFAFNIQPWAWDYLRNHRELIVLDVPTDSDGRIIPYDSQRY